MPGRDLVAANLAAVRERIRRAGGDPAAVAVVAVTKGQPVEACRAAVGAGLPVLGENRVQEALGKMDAVPGAEWHLIGHLQTNKAKDALELFDVIQSVDRLTLASEIARRAGAPADGLARRRNASTRSGMSLLRSRSGGTSMRTTLSR